MGSAQIVKVLNLVGGDLALPLGKVTYASKCYIKDQLIAHFVVENDGEAYTLILIPEASIEQLAFENDRWRGLITPHETGILAVIASADSSPNLLEVSEHYSRTIKRLSI
ncbi:MAG: DUF3379 family protein [Pseudomonadales bacterium]